MLNKRLALLPVLFFLSLTLYGLESFGITAGVMYVRNSSDEGAPSPILPYLGATASFALGEKSFLEPSLIFNWNYYLWSSDEEMALPAEIEYADSVLLLNIVLDCPFVMKYKIKNNVSWGWLASPAFIFRIPLKSWGEGDSDKSDILSYFYGGRFIFLEAGGLVEWDYSAKNSLKAKIDVLLPIYNIWDGGSFSNQLSVRLGLTFSFIPKSAQKQQPAAEIAPSAAE